MNQSQDSINSNMQDINKISDENLAKLSITNQDYFYHLLKRYEKKMLRYIMRTTDVSFQGAEDITQNIFIKVYENLNDFDSDLKFSSWIYRIAHNEIISQFRKRQSRAQTVSMEDDKGKSLVEIINDTYNLHEDYLSKEMAEKVRDVIALLPMKYKEVLILRYLEERDYSEISDILCKPIGTVAALINRAKKHFKNIAEQNQLSSLL
ncbi:MAG: sigma-70 family RNA polymerase sigma factor [Patescibacteria group bacterium]|nr:sigma-70 family RNA polymerase sigma factor [Patescibacteria group bacterium]